MKSEKRKVIEISYTSLPCEIECPFCNAKIQIDHSGPHGFCEHLKTFYSPELIFQGFIIIFEK